MPTIPFRDTTDSGNEKALKKGFTVPDGAVNIAYTNTPALSPRNNIVLIDSSRIIQENLLVGTDTTNVYYADGLGVLQDQNGNQVIHDQFPTVSDVFTRDVLSPATNDFGVYTTKDALPYVHVSRFFHLDVAGISLGGLLTDAIARPIKIVDGQGSTYTYSNGSPRYRIKLVPTIGMSSPKPDWAYRVYAYVDTNTREDLYLVYDKCEIDADGNLQNQVIAFKELLNPVSGFQFRSEEADVVDLVNRSKKIYSTKPASLKEQALGLPVTDIDGYKVYVPKKALSDPRIFQLFSWRLRCDFTNTLVQTEESRVINAGVVVTNANPASGATYAFYNLQQSNFNKLELNFMNPLQSDHSDSARQNADYWYVNFDSIKTTDLNNFDILIWNPTTTPFDFSPYLGMINYFTNTIGKTLMIDTDNKIVPQGLGVDTTLPIDPGQNEPINLNTATLGKGLDSSTLKLNISSPLISGSSLGGYDITPDSNSSPVNLVTYNNVSYNPPNIVGQDSSGAYLTYAQFLYGANAGYVQYITNFSPTIFTDVVTGTYTYMGNG